MLGQSHLVAEDEAADVASRRRQEARVRVKLEMLPELVEPSERLVAEGAAVLLLLLLLLKVMLLWLSLLRQRCVFTHVVIVILVAPCNGSQSQVCIQSN